MPSVHNKTLRRQYFEFLGPTGKENGDSRSCKATHYHFTKDRASATPFYRDTLGRQWAYEDSFATVLNIGGATLRLSVVADFKPHEHTIN
jgi:hypothetical protein